MIIVIIATIALQVIIANNYFKKFKAYRALIGY